MSETGQSFTLRQWVVMPLSLVIWLLGAISIGVISALSWWSHRVCPWLSSGIGNHFYWPFVQIRRVLEGKPRWLPIDLKIGKQPRTDAERAAAELDLHVFRFGPCLCPDPECPNKAARYMYNDVPRVAGSTVDDVTSVTLPEELQKLRDESVENARKAANYDQLVENGALKDESIRLLTETLKERGLRVEALESTIASQDGIIRSLDRHVLLLKEKIELLESRHEAVRESLVH